MSTQPEQPKKRTGGVTGLAIPAGLLIGIGVGFLVDNVTAGVLLGLGACPINPSAEAGAVSGPASENEFVRQAL